MLTYNFTIKITVLIFIVLLILDYFISIPLWFYASILIVAFLITALGSSLIQWNFHFKSLNSNKDTINNHIAITFDDGPHPEFTPQVLKLLKSFNAKATFFCIGKHIEAYPEILKSIINEGHVVGNHTYSHTNTFGFFKTQRVEAELNRTNQAVNHIIGEDLRLFRPAFGVTNPRIKRAITHLNLTSIGWNKRSLDTTNLNVNKILKRVTKGLKKGDVILLHDTSEKSIVVLEQLLLFLQHQKMTSVSIDTLFNIKAYA